jgi:hypothetical protein
MKRWGWFAICSFFILMSKENMCGVVFILGFYAAVFRGEKVKGLAWMAIAVSMFFMITKVFVPMMNSEGYFYQQSFESVKNLAVVWERVMSLESLGMW